MTDPARAIPTPLTRSLGLALVAAAVLGAAGAGAAPPAGAAAGASASSSSVGSPAHEASSPRPEAPVSDTLPTPFTADQIRAAMPVGHKVLLRTQEVGRAPIDQTWEVVAASLDTVTLEYRTAEGKKTRETTRWTALRDHASFPAASTLVARERIDAGPLGALDCTVYTVHATDERGNWVRHYWFADAWPGPPVRVHVLHNGQDALRMAVLGRQ